MGLREEALALHKEHQGKLSIVSKVAVKDQKDLSLAYSPGVAEPCLEIKKNPSAAYEYTNKGNFVAVVSDGSAVLGLGDIGPVAALPVMEGKAILFKAFAGVDAFPICLATKDVDEVVDTVARMAPTFGGVNLEDISGPRCFEIERKLKARINIPVFHDDQHGTAVVCLAGLINALKVSGKSLENVSIVINGAGAAGDSITRLLRRMGCRKIMICDQKGIIHKGRREGMTTYKEQLAEMTNPEDRRGGLKDAVQGADVFIGVSVANIATPDMVRSMNDKPMIFALANPVPEIMPEEARKAGAAIIATGRSDYPNQVNNVLGFPGIFRGALDVRAKCINEEMKIAAVYAIANLIVQDELAPDYIIPKPFDKRVVPAVAEAVALAAMETKVAQKFLKIEELRRTIFRNIGV
ncbi:MAG: NAD(P)-dependent malic enzyme [Bacillota bacterium]